jgi:polyisoprenoid-binding protein YceI
MLFIKFDENTIMMKAIASLFVYIVLSTGLQAQTLQVKSDAVKISFLADKQKTDGTIGGFEAKIIFNTDQLAKSSISGTVDVATIDTGIKKRDEHLRSSDYFDVENYPKISFQSTSIEKTENGFKMVGLLKIKDKAHQEEIQFTFNDNIFKGKMNIQLSNYDVGDFSTAKKNGVAITFHIPVTM